MRTTRTRERLATAAIACGLTVLGAAQADPRALRPVEQGVADTGPLSANRRVVPLDLRVPSGFDRVYQFGRGSSSKFARMNGGLTAVFPRSTYADRGTGTTAEIPPGTVFYVGKLPDALFGGGVGGLGARPMPRSPMLADTSALATARAPIARPPDTRLVHRTPDQSSGNGEPIAVLSVFGDPEFRTRRIGGLLDRALQAGADRTGPDRTGVRKEPPVRP